MLQNQRVRSQPLDEEKLADLDLDNTDFDDNIELPDLTMETETIENEDDVFREEPAATHLTLHFQIPWNCGWVH